MFGGGEEFFKEPDHVSRDSLEAFSNMGALLRNMTSKDATKRKTIDRLCELAEAVGVSEQSTELVVGLLLRHIKANGATPQQVIAASNPHQSGDSEGGASSDIGKKQLGCWYVLDKLCRSEGRDRYAHTASTYMTEVADYIPWENSKLAASYRTLMEGWRGTFPEHVVQALWGSQEVRRMRLQNPAEYRTQLLDEEKEWAHEESNQEDGSKLNEYGQPCMDYMQGRCTWGDQCKQLHPPGLEGSLPPECRLGDWKCVCGTINRHFRRRCSSCPKEKPQYRRNQQVSAEEALLTHPEDFTEEFRHQFGYNPNVEEEALKYWRKRFAILDRDAAAAGSSSSSTISVAGGGAGVSSVGRDVEGAGAGAVASGGGGGGDALAAAQVSLATATGGDGVGNSGNSTNSVDAAFSTSARALRRWKIERSLAYRARILRFNRALGMMLPPVSPPTATKGQSSTNLLAESEDALCASPTSADHEALLLASKQINWAQPLKEDYDPSVVLEQPVTKRHRGEQLTENSATYYKYTSQGLRDLVAAALKTAKVDGALALAAMPALERVGTIASLVTDRGISTGTPELLVALSKTLDEVAILSATEMKIDCVGIASAPVATLEDSSKASANNKAVYRGVAAVVHSIYSTTPSKAAGLLTSGGGKSSSVERLFNVAKLVFGGIQTGKLPGRAGFFFFHSIAPFLGIDVDVFVRVSVASKTGEVLCAGYTKESAMGLIDDLQSVPMIGLGEDRVNQLRTMVQHSVML